MVAGHPALLVLMLLLAVCITLQVAGERGQGRKGKKELKANGTRSGMGQVQSGKFSTKDKAHCTWLANGEGAVTLHVTCRIDSVPISCQYMGSPGTCPQYTSNPKAYWKQVARVLKKQKDICRDPKAIIKTALCKKAPKEAHFRLATKAHLHSPVSSVAPERATAAHPSAANSTCAGRVDRAQLAEQHCGQAWSSLCHFLFTMVQNDDC